MDNASKALLMAGAVLITIMLISLGMWFLSALRDYNSNEAIIKRSAEAEAFNRYFVYASVDSNVTGAEALNLISKAREYCIVDGINIELSGGSIFENTLASSSSFIYSTSNATWSSFIQDISKNESFLNRQFRFSYRYGNDGKIDCLIFSR